MYDPLPAQTTIMIHIIDVAHFTYGLQFNCRVAEVEGHKELFLVGFKTIIMIFSLN